MHQVSSIPNRDDKLMFNAVASIASEVFGLPVESIRPEMTPDDVSNWDSLNHMRLITAIEARFGVRLSMVQIQQIRQLGDFCEFQPAVVE